METLRRTAERILETALEANDGELRNCTMSVGREGAIGVSTEQADWSLAALAAEMGASAVYRVERRMSQVSVEAWSLGKTCLLRRKLPGPPPYSAPLTLPAR